MIDFAEPLKEEKQPSDKKYEYNYHSGQEKTEEKELVADSPKFVDQSISTSNNRPTEVHFGASDALTAKDNTGNHEHSGEEHTN